jgi:hypothetical protein
MKVKPDIKLRGMTHQPYSPYAGETALHTDSDGLFDAAKVARTPEAALKLFKAAHKAQERQDIVEQVMHNALHLARTNYDPLVTADYFLFIAEKTNDTTQKIPALEAVMAFMRRAMEPDERKVVDNAALAGFAARIIDVPVTDLIERIRMRSPALKLWLDGIHALASDDERIGTNNARIVATHAQIQSALRGNTLSSDVIAGSAAQNVFSIKAQRPRTPTHSGVDAPPEYIH